MTVGDIHVIQIERTTRHEPDEACICVPRLAQVTGADGEPHWMFIHHTLDKPAAAGDGEDPS